MALTPAERVGASAAGALALLYVARSYWRVPLAIWRRPISVQRAQLRYERAGDGPTPPAAATAWLADRAAALAALGFRGTPPFRETADTGVSMYHQLHEHAETGDVAAVGVFMRDAEEEVANTTISFRSVLADGSEVKTLHDARGLPVVTPDPPGSTVLRIGGGVQVSDDPSDLGRLYRLHRALVRRRGAGPQRRIDLSDPVAHHLGVVESLERQKLDSGWYRRDAEGRTWYTLRGAFVVVWRALPPWRGIANARERRLVTELMTEVITEELRRAGVLPAGR